MDGALTSYQSLRVNGSTLETNYNFQLNLKVGKTKYGISMSWNFEFKLKEGLNTLADDAIDNIGMETQNVRSKIHIKIFTDTRRRTCILNY